VSLVCVTCVESVDPGVDTCTTEDNGGASLHWCPVTGCLGTCMLLLLPLLLLLRLCSTACPYAVTLRLRSLEPKLGKCDPVEQIWLCGSMACVTRWSTSALAPVTDCSSAPAARHCCCLPLLLCF
jgi:hypothetical protein